ncbi:unnamed protein product [Tuber aestivum]|uniref:Adenylate kinase isoenzyme 6 homolog n=1 Tax=Tuber aestivum TaxID=59557 RepID=A0A292PUV1_9PEZI|nr:unnamed protein product [Tuber aestivum]
MPRTRPNIIITGTPGVGKSCHCELLVQTTELGLRHLSINNIVKERNCYDGYDDELKSHIVDEDKLLDEIENEAKEGGCIIDWHVCDLFPESWIDLVVVLRADSTILYDRLEKRWVSLSPLTFGTGGLLLVADWLHADVLYLWDAGTIRVCNPAKNRLLAPIYYTRGVLSERWLMASADKKLQENLDAEIMQVILEEAREAYDEETVIELRSDTTEEIDSNVDRISAWARHWIENNPEGV